MINRSQFLALVVVCSLSSGVFAQTRTPRRGMPPASGAQRPGGPSALDPNKPVELKKYDDVITKEAKTQTGLFKVHRIDDKVYWEIPANLLHRDFVWQAELAELPKGVAYPGSVLGLHVISFTRRNNKLFMRERNFDERAVGDSGTRSGVEASTVNPIIMSFDIQTEGPDKAPVIDATSLFTSDQLFPVGARMGMGGVDSSRSYIDRVKAFPQNIETRSWLTFAGGGGVSLMPGRRGGGGGGGSASTILVHYGIDLLPETPMRGRLKDSRIGYFTTDFTQYGDSENRAKEVRYINRFRLEKKDPKADVSEPVKPIVFYLPKEIPNKWRPYIKAGIEDWQPVFEKAGFKNAISCIDAPKDADWDPEDLRYNVIRWAPSQTENAMGGSLQDPRSGETIVAKVIVWNDIVKLLEDWDFVQTAAADPTSRALPFSDEKIGSMLRYVVGHEVGHTLGLEHNFKASVAYTVKQLRDPDFMKDHGTAASIMSYSRFDYVAQPGDGVTQYANMIGPYDYFAIEYGYKPIPGSLNAQDEKSTLDALLAKQVTDHTLIFGNYLYPGIDPGMQNENIGDDSIEATRLGLKNIDTISDAYLLPFTSKFGEEYDRLKEMEQNLLSQRTTEILHVVPMVGGVVQTDYHAGRGGEVFKPVPAARQAAAVHFLVTDGLATPKILLRSEVLNRLQPTGIVATAEQSQDLLITLLLSTPRIARIEDNEAQNGSGAYSVSQLVSDVSNGVWSEVSSEMPQIDVYRRSLQRSYLKTLDTKINGDMAIDSDLRELEKDDLKHLAKKIDHALPRTKDKLTYLHLQDCRTDIERILQDKYSSPSGGGGMDLSFLFGLKNLAPVGAADPYGCWTPFETIREAVEEVEQDYKPKAAAPAPVQPEAQPAVDPGQ
jgi:Met-zincin/Domain of unknown function (DUF5117)/Domain of unknown function (DUF5118)